MLDVVYQTCTEELVSTKVCKVKPWWRSCWVPGLRGQPLTVQEVVECQGAVKHWTEKLGVWVLYIRCV